MKRDDFTYIKNQLYQVPDGTFAVEDHGQVSHTLSLFTEQLRSQTIGKGRMTVYPVFPGVEFSFSAFLAEQATFQHEPIPTVLEVNHCRMGRVGWSMKNGTSGYLGVGDLALQSMAVCADSAMQFPLGYYEGISLSIDLNRFKENLPDVLSEAGINLHEIQQKYCFADRTILIPSGKELESIFEPLYELPGALRLPYFQLKVQELILFLVRVDPKDRELTRYCSQQTQVIKEIHAFLTQDLGRRYTIEELSKQYLINTSTLKEVFKAVYGLPIATYMKEYRIKEAMKLLRETDATIADIAERVGYETQGKFTKAFKELTQTLPTQYRKSFRYTTEL